jgi:hypothetical protein
MLLVTSFEKKQQQKWWVLELAMVILMAMSAFGQGTSRSYYGGGHTHTRFNIEFGYKAIIMDGVMARSTLVSYIYNYLMP